MLSFPCLGNYGRFGNQLFQYAFLRTQAERLGVQFYCPQWIGDEIFDLYDASIRAQEPSGIFHSYTEPYGKDYDRNRLLLEDHTEVKGYFESEKNFNIEAVRQWYSFKEGKIARVKEKYQHIDFSKCVAVHVRCGDKMFGYECGMCYYVPRRHYYLQAIQQIPTGQTVLVFSDDIALAKRYLKEIHPNTIFIEGNEYWEDLYLMTQCYHGSICSSSTFSWWGSWLNNSPDARIVFPQEGIFRPGSGFRNSDLIPDRWIQMRALLPIVDNYFFKAHRIVMLVVIAFFRKNFPSFSRYVRIHFTNIQ